MEQICSIVSLHFMTFSPQLETYDALQCSFYSFPHMVIYILCVENWQNYIWTHSFLHLTAILSYAQCTVLLEVQAAESIERKPG